MRNFIAKDKRKAVALSLSLPAFYDGKRRIDVALFTAFFIFCFFAFLAVSSGFVHAQSLSRFQLGLMQDSSSYDLLPYTRMFEDKTNAISANDAVKIFKAGNLPVRITTDLVYLSKKTPHWLAFEVINHSRMENWVLSFGNQFNGRLGAPDEITVFNASTGEVLLDLRPDGEQGYVQDGNLLGSALPISIARGQSALIMVRLVADNQVPLIFPMQLESAEVHTAQNYSFLSQAHGPGQLFIIFFGGYLVLLFIRRDLLPLLFSVHVGLQCIAFTIQSDVFYSGLSYSADVKLLFLNLSVVSGLLLGYRFLNFNADDQAPNRLIILAAIASFVIMPAGLWAFPALNFIALALVFMPVLLIPLLMFLLSLGQVQNSVHGILPFAAGWFIAFLGSATTILAVLNFIPATEFKIYAVWAAALLQNALFMTALSLRHIQEDKNTRLMAFEERENSLTIQDIKKTKVGAENHRLLKLIKHEREVMNELREREIEQNTETRKAREAAEEANRAKSAFLAVISHEIRTPMTGVLGMARLLLQEQLTKKQKDYAQTIKDSGEAMVSLLNDILDFEKIENDKLDLEQSDFDLARLLNGVVTLMAGHASAKNIRLESEIDPSLPQIVIGDSVRLRQILLNLVGNAIKFTDEGSVTLIVKKQKDTEHEMTDKTKILFAIKDTGIGISPEAKMNLFNPFSQADSSITRKFGGTGLGLAISQRLVEAMGAEIEIDSTEGEGSTFFFDLSMKTGNAARAEGAETSAHQNKKKAPDKVLSILVVEDNQINQKLLQELLERLGHQVTIRDNGEDGVTAVKEHDFDAVLMDVHLPGISGMGATKAIRVLEDVQKASTSIIALTGNTASEDIRACYDANMNGYIPKPVDPALLEKTLDRLVKGDMDNPVDLKDRDVASEMSAKAEESKFAAPPEPKEPEEPLIEEPPHESSPGYRIDEDMPDNGGAKSYNPLDPPEEPQEDLPEEEIGAPPAAKPEDTAKSDDDNTAAIRAMARELEDFNFDEDDLDLEEDSFAAAIEIGVQDEKDSQAENAGEAPVLDPSTLDNLRRSIGHDKLEDMISEMFMKLDELSHSLRRAVDSNDQQQFLGRAHELKGMAANFGLIQIKLLLQRTETALKNEEIVDLIDVLKQLKIAEDKAKSALQQWVGASAESM